MRTTTDTSACSKASAYATPMSGTPRADLVTSAQVAERLSITPWLVNQMVRDGRLRCLNLGPRTRRFQPADLDAFLQRMSA